MTLGPFRGVGIALVIVGLVLFASPVDFIGIGLAQVVVDTTPPQFLSTFPAHTGWYSTVTAFSVRVDDGAEGSGVYSVSAILNEFPAVSLAKSTFDPSAWTVKLASPITQTGNYILKFIATDYARNGNNINIAFSVGPLTLAGKWFINNIEISTSTDKFITQSRTVTFKFVKDPNVLVSSSQITVTVSCDSSKTPSCSQAFTTRTLPTTDTQTWTTSVTIPDGRYSFVLKADAGSAGVVALNFVGEIGNVSPFNITAQQILGVVITIFGVALIAKGDEE